MRGPVVTLGNVETGDNPMGVMNGKDVLWVSTWCPDRCGIVISEVHELAPSHGMYDR